MEKIIAPDASHMENCDNTVLGGISEKWRSGTAFKNHILRGHTYSYMVGWPSNMSKTLKTSISAKEKETVQTQPSEVETL